MLRSVIAALLALLWMISSRESAAQVCDAPTSGCAEVWLCRQDCVQIAADSPAAAQVTVCAGTPEEAMVRAQQELLGCYGCANEAYDGSGQSTLDTLTCGLCHEQEWCNAQGGILQGVEPPLNSQGGLLDGLYTSAVDVYETVCALIDTTTTTEFLCRSDQECDVGCEWDCAGTVFGYFGQAFPSFETVNAGFVLPCSVSHTASAEVLANDGWGTLLPYATVIASMTTCAPTNQVNATPCPGPDDDTGELCMWECTGKTKDDPLANGQRLDLFLNFISECEEDNKHAEYIAWRHAMDEWRKRMDKLDPWKWILIDIATVQCVQAEGTKP